jgi:predicted flap endonuclease-1-like 5' DNA nuclease
MKDTAPKEQRILKIAAISGLIVALLGYVLLNFGFAWACLVGLIVSLVVAVALWVVRGQAGIDSEAAAVMGVAGADAPARTAAALVSDQPVVAQTDSAAAVPAAQAAGQGGDDAAAIRHAQETDIVAAGVMKPSARLAGQEELASRKGSWKYEGASAVQAQPGADPAPVVNPGADGALQAAAQPSADGLTGPADKPQMLSAPRGGEADNLKYIKGVGPKLESTLHEIGVFHFDQIAGWTAAEESWMDGNLAGFRGRVSRDNWIAQAKILAAGGETVSSKKAGKGGVY